ncbi:MAG: response regulator, partial [Acidobacteriales bacterium]|nr:response regulator [Terriglobales bacterium]
MPFQVLIVSEDTDSCAKLSRLFPGLGASVQSCGYGEGALRLSGQRFDVVAIDFDDPQGATSIVENCSHMSPGARVVILALLTDKTKLRHAFGAGANFVLYKPFSEDQARATLFDVAVLVKKERRNTPRVPVQMPIQLKVSGGQGMEAIALALSQHGMEVLAAQPLCPSSKIETLFRLPGSSSQLQLQGEVAWASPNGHAGVRFDFAEQG